MIAQSIPAFQITTTNRPISSFCGLPLLYQLAHWLGLPQQMERLLRPRLKQRQRGYSVSQLLLSLVMLLAGGGERLDDIRRLQGDPALTALTDLPRLPEATTLGRFLHRFTQPAVVTLGRLVTALAGRLQTKHAPRRATLDVDATIIEAQKQEAQWTYTHVQGYQPLMAFLAETQTILGAQWRPGNTPAGAQALPFLKRCGQALPDGIEQRFLRSDSAWYQAKVLDYCHDHGIGFAIGADQDAAVTEVIAALPEAAWGPFDAQELAETAPCLNEGERAYRLIVLRTRKAQGDLFAGPFLYWALITNREEKAPWIVRWHRQRATSENWIKEAKHGLALAHPPCGTFLANAAFTQIVALTYNLVQVLKYEHLPASWRSFTIKTLRFRLFHLGSLIVRHARRLIVQLPASYADVAVYETVACRVRGPCPV
ncbi:MAG: IS1380 family transposase [Anaerolineae bacterium]